MMQSFLTDYHAKYFAHELTKRCSSDSLEKLAGAVASAQVDLNPHQVDAALFAFNSPLSKGALLADEVGLGKTIEAGLVLSQKWAERKRRVLVITPANLRKQWHQELTEKFFLPCQILETKSYNDAVKRGNFRPLEIPNAIVICSYQFARSKAADVANTAWDLVVVDEAHRLRTVKEPAVVTRKNFNPAGMTPQAVEQMKLEDGVRLHESVKVELETYARESNQAIVKPFVLVIARDTTHAGQLMQLIQSDAFFEGRYKTKVIQVDSSKTGAEEDEMVERLLKVEKTDEPTEIVIHVNMLKEGWDVTNLYTIIPLRAANARTLIEQSIGRGLRLPYGKRTGVNSVDRLNIVAHDKFQEIVDEAKKPDSAIRLQQVILEPEQLGEKTVTVVSQSQLASKLGFQPEQTTTSTLIPKAAEPPVFTKPEDQKVAQITFEVIRKLESQPQMLPSVSFLAHKDVQEQVAQTVASLYRPSQLELDGVTTKPDIAAIVAKTSAMVIQQTIDIPRIFVVPTGNVQSGFKPFTLNLDTMRYAPVDEELWAKHLRTDEVDIIAMGKGGMEEARLEDYVVSGLVDFDDISYDAHSDLLYDLAAQVVHHLRTYLPEEEISKILRCYQRDIARFVHAQMQDHYWEEATGYETKITRGTSALKPSAYTASAADPVLDYRVPPADKSNMAKYLFGGFQKCLYPVQKFQSDSERKLSVILEREAVKWFKPAKGQFQIYYKSGADHVEYQPDFVAETKTTIYMMEPKKREEMEADDVLAKMVAAVKWCKQATDHAATCGGKPWHYLLIPHDTITENMTIASLAGQFGVK